MIIDLQKFINNERRYWEELESVLTLLEKKPEDHLNLDELKNFHYLYERTSSDLARISVSSFEKETLNYLESLVARAYGEIHETRKKPHHFKPLHWFFVIFPRTFRKHIKAFQLSVAITIVGCIFGGLVVTLDPPAKKILIPFDHLMQSPSQRVVEEEKVLTDRLKGEKNQLMAFYITHNTKVSIFTIAMGATWGIGTIILLFSNGIMLGTIVVDYITSGETEFLTGWLLPHGSVEIPAILLAGQAGFLIAGTLIGYGSKTSIQTRLRKISKDMVTLIIGIVILLIWAGIVEAFLSQYHEPTIPYNLKISFGIIEIILLTIFLCFSGKKKTTTQKLY